MITFSSTPPPSPGRPADTTVKARKYAFPSKKKRGRPATSKKLHDTVPVDWNNINSFEKSNNNSVRNNISNNDLCDDSLDNLSHDKPNDKRATSTTPTKYNQVAHLKKSPNQGAITRSQTSHLKSPPHIKQSENSKFSQVGLHYSRNLLFILYEMLIFN